MPPIPFAPLLISWRRRRLFRRCLQGTARSFILRYHSVGEPNQVSEYLDPGLSLPPDRFRAHLKLLGERFEIVPLERIAGRLQGPRPGRMAVAITFDDGYRDNRLVAMPLLQEAGATASFFVTTQPLTSGRGLWISELWRLVPKLPDGAVDLPAGAPSLIPAQRDRRERERWRRRLTSWMASVPVATREQALDALATGAGVPRGEGLRDSFVSPDDLRAMQRAGMTIGSHTYSHPHLDLCDAATRLEEPARGRRDLEALLGSPVDTFAYPNPGGSGLAGAAARDAVASAGYRLAVTSQSHPLEGSSQPLRLPRLGVYAGAQERTLFELLGSH